MSRRLRKLREELTALSRGEVSTRYDLAKAEDREAALIWNWPQAAANYSYWCKVSNWSLDEIVALLLKRSPEIVTWETIKSSVQISPFAAQYAQLKRIVDRAEADSELPSKSPWSVATWARAKKLEVPEELRAELEAHGMPIADLFAALKNQQGQIEAGKAEVAELRSRIASFETSKPTNDEKSLNKKERRSLHRMLVALARTVLRKSEVDRDGERKLVSIIQDRAALIDGKSLDDETIRKHLRAASATVSDLEATAKMGHQPGGNDL